MKISAGILPYRYDDEGRLEVYLAHFGGPYWRNKERSWGIVKGEVEDGEDLLDAAKREFYEETGKRVDGDFLYLGAAKSSKKVNHVFAIQTDLNTQITPNTFTIEWPPGSGQLRSFPEIDRVAWWPVDEAKKVIVESQKVFLDRLEQLV